MVGKDGEGGMNDRRVGKENKAKKKKKKMTVLIYVFAPTLYSLSISSVFLSHKNCMDPWTGKQSTHTPSYGIVAASLCCFVLPAHSVAQTHQKFHMDLMDEGATANSGKTLRENEHLANAQRSPLCFGLEVHLFLEIVTVQKQCIADLDHGISLGLEQINLALCVTLESLMSMDQGGVYLFVTTTVEKSRFATTLVAPISS